MPSLTFLQGAGAQLEGHSLGWNLAEIPHADEGLDLDGADIRTHVWWEARVLCGRRINSG